MKGHMAITRPPQANLFKKKPRALTCEDTKALLGGIGHHPPTKGMTVVRRPGSWWPSMRRWRAARAETGYPPKS